MFKIVRVVNNSLPEHALSGDILDQVFTTYWPQFENSFRNILSNTDNPAPDIQRTEDDILTEILLSVRDFNKRIRRLESNSQKNSVTKDHIKYPSQSGINTYAIAFTAGNLVDVDEMVRSINVSLNGDYSVSATIGGSDGGVTIYLVSSMLLSEVTIGKTLTDLGYRPHTIRLITE